VELSAGPSCVLVVCIVATDWLDSLSYRPSPTWLMLGPVTPIDCGRPRTCAERGCCTLGA
jgi:hypothetical protein